MPRKKTSIHVEGVVGLSLIQELARRDVYYNGRGRFRCSTAMAADEAVAWIRDQGLDVERCAPPEGQRLTHAAAAAISRSVEIPRRWSL